MEILTSKDGRVALEQRAVKVIMIQKDTFKVNDIMMLLRDCCDDSVDMDQIEEVVYNALEYCIVNNIVDIYDEFSYMVNPVEQILFEQNNI